jgi:hypothetical protein
MLHRQSPVTPSLESRAFSPLAILLLTLVAGCAKFTRSEMDALAGEAKGSNLTTGMVKLKIEKGRTDQAAVLEVFGPPDQVTHRGDLQIWTYDKISYQTRVDAGSLAFYEASSRVSQSVSTMLIVYFGPDDVVRDYRLDSYRF